MEYASARPRSNAPRWPALVPLLTIVDVVDVRASATARGVSGSASCVGASALGDDAHESATTLRRRWWAHQDSNLEQAGYEPAALTVELWARPTVYSLQRAVASRRCYRH